MKYKGLFGAAFLLFITFFFVLATYLANANLDFFINWMGASPTGMAMYVFVIILAAVLAPISVLPLVPIATAQWGWITSGFLTLIGEMIGAIIAFFIAKNIGYPIISRILDIDKLHGIEKFIPDKHFFAGIVILRVAVPIDVVSYALGLFSSVKWKTYIFASFLGLIPYAFITAYLGGLPFILLINLILTGLILFFIIIIIGLRSRKDYKKIIFEWWSKEFK